MSRIRIALLLALVGVVAVFGLASAQIGYTTDFITSITFQNVGDAQATVQFQFYNEKDGTPIEYEQTVEAGAGSSLFVGSPAVGLPADFSGSAVLSSGEPIVATVVQIPQPANGPVKNRPLSNGFDAGADRVLIATVLKNQFNTTTRFSVQNVGTSNADAKIQFFPVGQATPIEITETNIPGGAAKYFDLGLLDQLGGGPTGSFDGSAVVLGTVSGQTTPAPFVASAMELSTNSPLVRAFEGVTGGSTTVYMPSALCGFPTTAPANSAYAVQNTSTTATANVTVSYSNGNQGNAQIGPGNKVSFLGCNDGNQPNFNGSATITSVGADIVVIGKVGGSGRSTAFLGESTGSAKLALPYVRWTSDANYQTGNFQRANIAIQNVAGSAVSGVQLRYLNKLGQTVGIHTLGSIAPGAKANSNAIGSTLQGGFQQIALEEFGNPAGQPDNTGFGGAVIIEGPAGSQLVAVVRIASFVPSDGSTVGEDYNGIAIQ
jgi:hypothetical protein